MVDAFDFLGSRRCDVESLCKAYAVKSLRLFGSASTGAWNPDSSDFDFVVEFDPAPAGVDSFDQYFEFKAKLEAILERFVDLVELTAVKNEYFRRNLERTARDWYAA